MTNREDSAATHSVIKKTDQQSVGEGRAPVLLSIEKSLSKKKKGGEIHYYIRKTKRLITHKTAHQETSQSSSLYVNPASVVVVMGGVVSGVGLTVAAGGGVARGGGRGGAGEANEGVGGGAGARGTPRSRALAFQHG